MTGATTSSAVAAARRVVADPRRAFTLPHREILAICRALVSAEDDPVSQVSDGLAATVHALVEAEAAHTLAKGPDGHADLKAGVAREIAFLTFRAAFEQEFSNEQD